MTSNQPTSPVRFGRPTFDRVTRQLTCGAAPVHLTPKAFDRLSLLIAVRPRPVAGVPLGRVRRVLRHTARPDPVNPERFSAGGAAPERDACETCARLLRQCRLETLAPEGEQALARFRDLLIQDGCSFAITRALYDRLKG